MYRLIFGTIMAILLLALFGCGGGGGGGGDEGGAAASVQATMATVAATGTPSGLAIGGLLVTLRVPPGITVKTDPLTGEVAREAVQFVGGADPAQVFVAVDFLPGTGSAGGELKFIVVNTVGFGVGEFIRVQLDITPGFFPTAADFSLSGFAVSDLDGNLLSGLEPKLTADIY